MRSDAGFIRAHLGKSRNRLRGRGKGQNLLFTFLHILPSPRSSPPSGCFPGHFPDGVHRWRSDPTIPLVGSRRIGRALCPAAPVDVTAAKSVRVVPAERQNTHDPTRARPARSSGSSEHRSRKYVLLKRRVTFGAIREKDCGEEDREVVRYPGPMRFLSDLPFRLQRGRNGWTKKGRKSHAAGNEIPSPSHPGGARLPVRRLAGVVAGWLAPAPVVLPGHGRSAQPCGSRPCASSPDPPPREPRPQAVGWSLRPGSVATNSVGRVLTEDAIWRGRAGPLRFRVVLRRRCRLGSCFSFAAE